MYKLCKDLQMLESEIIPDDYFNCGRMKYLRSHSSQVCHIMP